MTSVIKHELRAAAGSFGSYHPEGWHPKLSVTLAGPTPAGCELVWVVARPDGAPWFEHRVPAPVLDARQYRALDLELWRDELDLDEAGDVPFSLHLIPVSDGPALGGAAELLHEGRMLVVKLPGEHRYAVQNDWMQGRCLLSLDTADEPDAPRLGVELFVKGELDAWKLDAVCLRDGTLVSRASAVEGAHTFTANDGQTVGQLLTITFDGIRGWNNLTSEGWGGDWHLLDQHDGRYEVRLLHGSEALRVVGFEVLDGRIVAPPGFGAVEPDEAHGAVIVVGETLTGAGVPEARGGGDSYGDPVTAAAVTDLDEIYALRRVPAAPQAAGALVDDEARRAVQAFVDRAERLLLTWESELASLPPYEFGQVLAAEAVGRERPGCEELASAVAGVPDDHPVELSGETLPLGELRARAAALFPAAEALIRVSQQSEVDGLAPYRALLAGDRLAVFDEHPADSFLYTTLDRHVIETPEQIAAAEYWFFEGPLDIPGSGRVDGMTVTGSVEGWRVLGWQFDASGAILAEFESQGQGSSAPKSAFRPPA